MDIKEQLRNFSAPSINHEICGFLHEKDGDIFFEEVKNRSPEPSSFFYISSVDFLTAKSKFNLCGIFHNHNDGTSEASTLDKTIGENTLLPMVIYSNCNDEFGLYIPQNCEIDVKTIEKLRVLFDG